MALFIRLMIHWVSVLTTLKTRELMTGRGAGTALIKWGMHPS